MNPARESWIAYGASIVLGLTLWTVVAVAEMRLEPWDAPSFWTIYYPAAIGLSGVLGFVFPARPWRWAVLLMFMQLPIMVLGGSGFSLLPMGLILMAVLALPAVGLAYLCAWAKQRAQHKEE
jgi:hypothetical protein